MVWTPLFALQGTVVAAEVVRFSALFPTVGVWRCNDEHTTTPDSLDDYYMHELSLQRLLSGKDRPHPWHDTVTREDSYAPRLTRPLHIVRVPHKQLFPPGVQAPTGSTVQQWKKAWLPHRAQVTLLHMPFVLHHKATPVLELLTDSVTSAVQTTLQLIIHEQYERLPDAFKPVYQDDASAYFARTLNRTTWPRVFDANSYTGFAEWWTALLAVRHKLLATCCDADGLSKLVAWASPTSAIVLSFRDWYQLAVERCRSAELLSLAPQFQWTPASNGDLYETPSSRKKPRSQ